MDLASASWKLDFATLTLRGRNLTDAFHADWSGYASGLVFVASILQSITMECERGRDHGQRVHRLRAPAAGYCQAGVQIASRVRSRQCSAPIALKWGGRLPIQAAGQP